MEFTTALGLMAGAMTTMAYLPQVIKNLAVKVGGRYLLEHDDYSLPGNCDVAGLRGLCARCSRNLCQRG